MEFTSQWGFLIIIDIRENNNPTVYMKKGKRKSIELKAALTPSKLYILYCLWTKKDEKDAPNQATENSLGLFQNLHIVMCYSPIFVLSLSAFHQCSQKCLHKKICSFLTQWLWCAGSSPFNKLLQMLSDISSYCTGKERALGVHFPTKWQA